MTFTDGAFQAVDEDEFVDLLKKHADLSANSGSWTDSGDTEARLVFSRTIGVFVKNFGSSNATTRLNDPEVRRYVLAAIAAIGSKATELAENGQVDGWHVRAAAKAIIKKFRKLCPQQIRKGTFEKDHPSSPWAHGDLCRDFETREE